MPIEVVMRESQDDFEVFSVAGYLAPGSGLMRDLDDVLDNGGSNQQILLNLATHLLDHYPGSHWSIKVERWDGYVYWLRFDGPELAAGETSRPVVSEPVVRISRYRRDPVL